MHRTENVELTVLCLLQDGDRILLQNRVKNDWQGYTLPGGHVEPDESFVDAVIREMKEETGLTIIEPKLAGVKQFPIDNGRYVVLLFKATKFTGSLVSSEEGPMEWVDCYHLADVKTVDDFDDLLKVINDPSLTEFQYKVDGDNWNVLINNSGIEQWTILELTKCLICRELCRRNTKTNGTQYAPTVEKSSCFG